MREPTGTASFYVSAHFPLLSLLAILASDSLSHSEGAAPGIRVTVRRSAQHPAGASLPETALNSALLQHLHRLSITGYEAVIAQLLEALGYEQVQILRNAERRRRSHKGRNRHGGVDLTATARSGLLVEAVLVQVKQYERPVSRRFVDELRGALLRTKSRHALLITTSKFSPAARRAAQEKHIAPVDLMDGDCLCALLTQHQIGVQPSRRSRPQIDRDYFRRLKTKHPALSTDTITITPRNSAARSGQRRAETKHPIKQPSAPLVGDRKEKEGGMMGRTHALLGIATLWLLQPLGLITQDNLLPLVLSAVLGALAPDLDASESTLKRFAVAGITPFAPLSYLLHQSFGHRGLMHSLLGLGLFTVLCALPLAWWQGWGLGMALSLGYASHLLEPVVIECAVALTQYGAQRIVFGAKSHFSPGWYVTNDFTFGFKFQVGPSGVFRLAPDRIAIRCAHCRTQSKKDSAMAASRFCFSFM